MSAHKTSGEVRAELVPPAVDGDGHGSARYQQTTLTCVGGTIVASVAAVVAPRS